MTLTIEDDTIETLVRSLAARRGVSEQELVRTAVEAEARREHLTLREKLERFWIEHPMPAATGLRADKAFFDELSGEP